MRACSIDGCSKPVKSMGFCNGHYTRSLRGQDLYAPWKNTRRPQGISEPEHFWTFVERGEGCWLWQGGCSTNGYGNFWSNGKTLRAHRYAWEITNGPVPDGLLVLHRCDTPRCCNPEHLFVGTPSDNTRDMHQKGRAKWSVTNCRCGAYRSPSGAPCRSCGDGAEENPNWREERIAPARRAHALGGEGAGR